MQESNRPLELNDNRLSIVGGNRGSKMNYHQLINEGFSEDRAELMMEYLEYCEAMREYEESHPDAAEGYSVILADSYGVDESDVEECYFDVFPNVKRLEPFVFLGDGEIEIQLPEPLTPEEADFFSRNTDFGIYGRNLDLAYGLYDSRLVVRAKLYPAD